MGALTPGRTDADWPEEHKKPATDKYPKLDIDPQSPLFSQLGEDPRETSSAEEGEEILGKLCEAIQNKIETYLGE